MVFPIQTSKDSWPTTLKPIGTLFELSMVAEMQMSQWLTKNKLDFSIGVNPWIDTQNNTSS